MALICGAAGLLISALACAYPVRACAYPALACAYPRTTGDGADAGGGDPNRGRALFDKQCAGCHSLTKNHEGPQLQGVYGRAAGGAAGFAYSAALRKARIVWDENSLDKWLANPDAFVPGNDMDFLVAGAQQRRDIIAYLKKVSIR
jgi:cytochrome c